MRTYVRDLISVPRLVLEGCSPISSCGLSRGPWISPADCPIHRHVHDLREAHRARMRTGALISRGGLPVPPTYLSRERERSRPSASALPVPASRLVGFSDSFLASQPMPTRKSHPPPPIRDPPSTHPLSRLVRQLPRLPRCESLEIAIRGPPTPASLPPPPPSSPVARGS